MPPPHKHLIKFTTYPVPGRRQMRYLRLCIFAFSFAQKEEVRQCTCSERQADHANNRHQVFPACLPRQMNRPFIRPEFVKCGFVSGWLCVTHGLDIGLGDPFREDCPNRHDAAQYISARDQRKSLSGSCSSRLVSDIEGFAS